MGRKNEVVIEQILEYIKDERYKQAVLIDGEWGVGKTFFVKEILLEHLEKEFPEKGIYYFSLYGIASVDQLIDGIYSVMLESIIEKKLGDKAGKMVGKSVTFTSKLITAGLKYFNIESEDLPKLSDIKEIEKKIIIFDDLERCEVDINQILGAINNLVEHNNVKVILVTNQNEIGNTFFSKDISIKYQTVLDDRLILKETGIKAGENQRYTKEQLVKRTEELFSEDNFYKKVKEKLIGLTIYYQPDLATVFVSVVNKYITDNKLKNYLILNKQKIVNVFEEKKHYNIRTLIFALVAFNKFYTIINTLKFDPYKYIESEIDRVLRYTIFSSIIVKSGDTSYRWVKSNSKSGIVHYDRKNIHEYMLYGYRFVDDYLLQCHLSEEYVKETILEIVEEQKKVDISNELEKSLQFRKLNFWWKLEDEEIEKIISEIYKELQEQKYSPYYFKDIIVTFMQMEKQGFSCIDKDKIIDLMTKKLETYTEAFERHRLEVISDNSDFENRYNQMVKPLFEILDKRGYGEGIMDNSFLCDHKLWDDSFKEKCKKYEDIYIQKKAFFTYIIPEKFINEIQRARTIEIYNFMDGIRMVYSFSNLNEYFKADVPNIKEILSGIKIEEEKRTKKSALLQLKTKLEEYLKLIETPIFGM